MSTFETFGQVTGGLPGTAVAIFTASTASSLGTITAVGYLDDLGSKVKQNDIIWVNYADTSAFPLGEVATLGQFYVNITGGHQNLVAFPAGLGVPQYAQVAMTAAQFDGMYDAPVLLVAAPGANSMLVVNNIALVMTYGSAPFAVGGTVAAQYGATVHGAGVLASTTETAADFYASASTVFKLNAGAVLAPFSSCANAGLYLSNDTAAFTTGTGSSFIVKVNYHTISTVA